MDYGNSGGGAEFNWNYSMGGNGAGGASSVYPQVSDEVCSNASIVAKHFQIVDGPNE